MDEAEPYILNEINMKNYLKYKCNFPLLDKQKQRHYARNKADNNINKTNTIFIPLEQDSLFWCYYIILNGKDDYDALNVKNILTTKHLKIKYLTKVRENKPVLKAHKFDTISNIENNLSNDNEMSVKTFISLCAIDKLNVIFIRNNTYFEMIFNEAERIYIVHEIHSSKYVNKYGFEIGTSAILEKKETMFKIENINKPIKCVSFYKVNELINICEKLSIPIKNPVTNKNKLKQELYESIVQYIQQ